MGQFASYVLEQVSYATLSEKEMDYLCNCKSEINNVCNVVEGHCLQAMKIVHQLASGCFNWLIFGQQSSNPCIVLEKERQITYY